MLPGHNGMYASAAPVLSWCHRVPRDQLVCHTISLFGLTGTYFFFAIVILKLKRHEKRKQRRRADEVAVISFAVFVSGFVGKQSSIRKASKGILLENN